MIHGRTNQTFVDPETLEFYIVNNERVQFWILARWCDRWHKLLERHSESPQGTSIIYCHNGQEIVPIYTSIISCLFLRLLCIAYIVTIGFLLIEHRIHSNLVSHLYTLFMRDNRCWFDNFPLIFLRLSRRSQIPQGCISFLVLNDEWRIYFRESRDIVVTMWFAFKRNANVVYFSDGIWGETCNEKVLSLFLTGIPDYLCVSMIDMYDARGWCNFFRDFLGSKSL